jgi:hypothetical protein
VDGGDRRSNSGEVDVAGGGLIDPFDLVLANIAVDVARDPLTSSCG